MRICDGYTDDSPHCAQSMFAGSLPRPRSHHRNVPQASFVWQMTWDGRLNRPPFVRARGECARAGIVLLRPTEIHWRRLRARWTPILLEHEHSFTDTGLRRAVMLGSPPFHPARTSKTSLPAWRLFLRVHQTHLASENLGRWCPREMVDGSSTLR